MDSIHTAYLIAEGRAAASTGRRRSIRLAARLSMADVAHDLGVSVDAVQRWETQNGLPRAAEAVAYALLLRRLDEYAANDVGQGAR